MLFVCIVAPITYAIVLIKKFTVLKEKTVRAVWGEIYMGLKIEEREPVVLQTLHYYFRRFILTVVIVAQDNLFVQLMIVHFGFCIQLILFFLFN